MRAAFAALPLLAIFAACAAEDAAPPRAPGPCPDGVCASAIRKFGFGAGATDATPADANVVVGFDLDGAVTELGDASGCGKPDRVSPEGEPGIDNQLGALLGAIGDVLVIVDGLVQQAINEGGILYAVEIRDWDGPGDRSARGRVIDLGSIPLLGNDGLVLRGQTLAAATEPVMGEMEFLVDAEGRRFQSTPFDLKLPIVVLDVDEVLDVRGVQVRFDRELDGTITGGLLGGGLMTDGILHIVNNYAVGDQIRQTVPGILDLFADLEPDDRGSCQALSVALTFEAVPVFTLDP